MIRVLIAVILATRALIFAYRRLASSHSTRKAPTRALIFLAVFILIPARRTASVECMYCRWVKYLIFWPSVGGGAMIKYPAKYGSNVTGLAQLQQERLGEILDR